jgi:cobalt-zinc-cadmium efflux system outer membrane protein
MMRDQIRRLLAAGAASVAALAFANEPVDLTREEARALALERNPELAAAAKELQATEGPLIQAQVLPNPELVVGGDNLGNSRKTEVGDRAAVVGFEQLVELGGKRAARVRIAEAGRDLAGWDYAAKRVEILAAASQRFAEVLASQARVTLATESVQLARDFADAVANRVQAGRVSPVEETRARLTVASAEIELEQARRELESARRSLVALWGEREPRFERAAGDLERVVPLPPRERLAERALANPALARWTSEVERRRASVEAERAKAVPDVKLSAGVSRFSTYNDYAYLVGISLPIPVFDQNRGGILEANRRLDKTADERRAAEARVLTELAQTYQRLAAIANEITTLRATLLPGARSAFDAATTGYQLGRFGFLDVLDAQRTLFQVRTQALRAYADYQRGLAEIEGLIGGPLDEAASPPRPTRN